MAPILSFLVLLTVGSSSSADPAASFFQRLVALEGEWEGSFEWTGARTGTGEIKARYHNSGNGSAIVEDLIQNGEPSMTTVYHLDGADLRMTHYCAAKNQPRLKASRLDEDRATVQFSFVDATNLAAPNAPRVDAFEIVLLEPDRIRLTFTFKSDAGESYERIDLTRIAAVAR